MEFLGFLFLLVLLLILIPVVRVVYTVWRMKRQFTRTFRQASEQQQQAYDKANADARKQRRKVFGKSDGEYVRFEEISIADNEPTVPEASFDKNKVEPRISDAEFEEILYNKRQTDE